MISTRNFLEVQGFKMGPAVVYQDNMSTIALVKNGKSNSDRTRHIAIRFFFVSDRVLNVCYSTAVRKSLGPTGLGGEPKSHILQVFYLFFRNTSDKVTF